MDVRTGELFELEVAPLPSAASRRQGESDGPVALHRIHAAPAAGKGGVSFDVGEARWRPEAGGTVEERRAMAYRLALAWNLCEGIPTPLLEEGLLAELADARRELLAAWRAGEDLTRHLERLEALASRVETGTDRSNDRLHDCPSCLSREAGATAEDDEDGCEA